VGLGHRRLSIIDLEGGGQPMGNEDDSIQVVFNGEIYNFIELRAELESHGHFFKTRSDTEVIVHSYEQWGPDCVNRFNGIFAFGLWDRRKQQLLLARDHLGVKPLYYSHGNDRLIFASEVKALLVVPGCPREVNLRGISQLFTLRYVPSPDTLFSGIYKIPPAHYMLINSGGLTVRRYWNWIPRITHERDEGQLIEEYRYMLEDAVRLQMRSDVPVGLFLSSGVDSGALLAIMCKLSGQSIRTFTIGFAGGEKSNETDDARRIAAQFGAQHEEMIVSAADYQKYYERYLWDLEEPVGNESAAAFYFVSLIASRQVKVALAGQGADEPWAGYHRYIGVKLSELYSRLPRVISDGLCRPVVERYAKNERWLRGVASLGERDMLTRLISIYSFYTPEMKTQLFQPWLLNEVSSDGREARESLRRLQSDVAHLDGLTQMVYIDTRANLPDDLLMVGDKTSMANSIEARVPYLDYRLVEFIESLPPQHKLRHFEGKYLHKRALERWVPKEVVYRKKKGFANPVDLWLRSGMRKYTHELLLSGDSWVGRYFDGQFIARMLADHESGRRWNLRHIYLLLSFELWCRTFIDRPNLESMGR
jgi:asparagine synthase (glutamine-hydrolysing)